MLHFAARREHVARSVRPALDAGMWVVCDRFADFDARLPVLRPGRAARGVRRAGRGGARRRCGRTSPWCWTCRRKRGWRGRRRAASVNRYEALDPAFHARVRAGFRAIAAAEPARCVVRGRDGFAGGRGGCHSGGRAEPIVAALMAAAVRPSRAPTRCSSAMTRPRGAMEEAARSRRLHHAWLIAGPQGLGKATLAYRFARWLLAGEPDAPAGAAAAARAGGRSGVPPRRRRGACRPLHPRAHHRREGQEGGAAGRGRARRRPLHGAHRRRGRLARGGGGGSGARRARRGAEHPAQDPGGAAAAHRAAPGQRAARPAAAHHPQPLPPPRPAPARRAGDGRGCSPSWLPDDGARPSGPRSRASPTAVPAARSPWRKGRGWPCRRRWRRCSPACRGSTRRLLHAVADKVAGQRDPAALPLFMSLLRRGLSAGLRQAARAGRGAAAPWVPARPLAEWSALWDTPRPARRRDGAAEPRPQAGAALRAGHAKAAPPKAAGERHANLHHDADLLRQRQAAYRPRLHLARRRRAGAVAAAAGARGLLPHRHGRARAEGGEGGARRRDGAAGLHRPGEPALPHPRGADGASPTTTSSAPRRSGTSAPARRSGRSWRGAARSTSATTRAGTRCATRPSTARTS